MGRKKERARTFGELPHDRVRGRGTAEFREPAVADVVHDLRHLSREGGNGGKGRKLNTTPRAKLLEFVGGCARGKARARGKKNARTYRQPPRAGMLEDFVARVLDRPLLERGGSLAVPHVLAHRAENTRDAFLKTVRAVEMVIRRVLGRKCVPPACATREPASRPDARSRESAEARLCSAHRRARARPREWRSCEIPARRSREKGSEMVHARNRVRTGFFPFRWRFQRVSTPKRPRFRRRVRRRRMSKQSRNGFFLHRQKLRNERKRDASNPFIFSARIILSTRSRDSEGKSENRANQRRPFTGFSDERGQFFPVEERISAFRGRRAVGQNSAASC